MRHSPSVAALAVALVAGAGFAVLARGSGSAAAAPQAGQFAVVDIPDLIVNSPGKRAIDASNKKRQEAFTAWDNDQQRKLKDMAGKYDLLPKADLEGRQKATHEFLLANAAYEAERKFQLQKAESDMGDELETLYAGVKNAAMRVAKQYGYVAVFTKTSEPLRISSAKVTQEFDAQVAARPLLYWDAALDITEMVKAEMLKAEPGTPPSPPPPPPAPPGPAPSSPGMH